MYFLFLFGLFLSWVYLLITPILTFVGGLRPLFCLSFLKKPRYRLNPVFLLMYPC